MLLTAPELNETKVGIAGFADVTILTAGAPARVGNLLVDCMESVRAQTLPVRSHLIGVDHEGANHGVVSTRLARSATTEWIMKLDDDDTLYPECIERLMAHAADAHVIYPYADVSDWPEDSAVRQSVNRPFDEELLLKINFIAGAAMIRREQFLEVGGMDDGHDQWNADWRCLLRLASVGCKFVAVPEVLWHYRRHATQQSAQRMPV